MAALSQAIAADTTPLYLDTTLTTNYPGRFTIETEVVYVHGGSGTAYVSVSRGMDGTTAVAHGAGTALVSAPLGSGGATPTLAEVLVAGNDGGDSPVTGLSSLVITSALTSGGKVLDILDSLSTDAEASVRLAPDGAGNASILVSLAAHNDGEARVDLSDDNLDGSVSIGTGGSNFITRRTGSLGNILALNTGNVEMFAVAASGVVRFALYSEAAGAPGGTLTTLLYGDTTAVTGGLYVWSGSAYRLLTGPLP